MILLSKVIRGPESAEYDDSHNNTSIFSSPSPFCQVGPVLGLLRNERLEASHGGRVFYLKLGFCRSPKKPWNTIVQPWKVFWGPEFSFYTFSLNLFMPFCFKLLHLSPLLPLPESPSLCPISSFSPSLLEFSRNLNIFQSLESSWNMWESFHISPSCLQVTPGHSRVWHGKEKKV